MVFIRKKPPSPVFGSAPQDLPRDRRRAAYAIVAEERRILCVHEASGLSLPGGGRLEGESLRDCVVRELAEECALEIRVTGVLGSATELRVLGERTEELCATFFRATILGSLRVRPALESVWIDISGPKAGPTFFRRCHAWAVSRALGLEPSSPRALEQPSSACSRKLS